MTQPMKRDTYKKPGAKNGMGCIHIEEVNSKRISYSEVVGWNYGWPITGQRHSTSVAQFERDGWEFVEVVD